MLLLVVGLLGLVFAIRGRVRGGSGLMVAAFAIMLAATAAGIAWQFVSLDAAAWIRTNHLSVDELNLIFLAVAIPLDVAAVLSWLLVALAVVKGGRPPRQAGVPQYPGGYPMPAPPYGNPHPGYGPPGQQAPRPPG
ncbi:hypothetical protein H480_20314 [Amycolatopsis vancoresmycina DSM 44592]|uniref:Uncharacterized protein n=1 Tax=Amycolatopsis vancoresmycina DSM 44592 TaxID=1292037 RepID=R1I2B4_9PSEU|nr:hypothetical protein H480_20314 [Amycolatopsis vancoresmycina DSM 44592]